MVSAQGAGGPQHVALGLNALSRGKNHLQQPFHPGFVFSTYAGTIEANGRECRGKVLEAGVQLVAQDA